jgi:hypothetical protein
MEVLRSIPESLSSLAHFPIEIVMAGETAQGTLKSVSCGDTTHPATIVISSDGKPLTFDAGGTQLIGYSDTLWYGADHFSSYRHLEGLRAIVRYKSTDDKPFSGKVTSLELREDIPAAPASANTEKTAKSSAPN